MRYQYLLIAVLLAVYLYMLVNLYLLNGPSWDLIAHYLNTRSALASIDGNGPLSLQGFSRESGPLYFEVFRAPLTMVLMAPFVAAFGYDIFGSSIFSYLMLLYALYAFAAYMFARSAKIGQLISFSLLLNPFLVYFLYVWDSEAALAIALVIIGIAFLIRRSYLAGLFLALASLAAYPALVFLPLLLFLWDAKKITFAALLGAAFFAPWLAANYALFGNPIYSYISSSNIAITYATPYGINLDSALATATAPFIFAVVAVALLVTMRFNSKRRVMPRMTYEARVLSASAILGLIVYVPIALHHDPFDQMRFGYLVAVPALMLIAYALQKESEALDRVARASVANVRKNLAKTAAILPFVLFLIALSMPLFYFTSAFLYNSGKPNAQNVIYNASEFVQVKTALHALNLSSCPDVSNGWIPLLYLNLVSYSPYSNYTDLPIVLFSNYGVNASTIYDLSTSRNIYNGTGFSILLPQTVNC